jgi:5-methylcytosine-specific restriction enzyme A
MPNPLPNGITKEQLIKAIRKIEAGIKHSFAESTTYDVFFEGKRYPPKAVVGIAAEDLIGRQLRPTDFTGGLKSKCFRILEKNEFTIITKGEHNPFPEEIAEENLFSEGQAQNVLVNV